MRRSLRGLWFMFVTAWRADTAHTIGAFGVTVLESVVRVIFPFLLRLIVDGALTRNLADIVIASSIWGLSIATLGITNLARVEWMQILQERTGFLIDQRIIAISTAVTTIEHHERADYLKEMDLLREQRGQLAGTLNAIAINVMMLIQVGGSVLLLASVHPMLVLLPLFAIPSIVTGAIGVGIEQRASEVNVEPIRTAAHVFEVSTAASSAKEIRVFGLAGFLSARYQDLWNRSDRTTRRAALKTGLLDMAGWTAFGVGYVATMIFVVIRAVEDPLTVSPGDVLMAFTIAGQLNGQVGGAVGMVRWLRTSLKTVGRYLWLEDFEQERRPAAGLASPQEVLRSGIDVTGVSFTYPGTSTEVLGEVDLHIPAGATVAIVGENGAGKTTLVKLLCRFYDPTEGLITVDGVPLAEIDPVRWRERVSAGFQDFAKFEFLARETVGVGSLGHIEDEPWINGALERAHAGDVVGALPGGLGTQVGKTFEDGAELSVGQWQKLALGRAMMRDQPLLLVLDEPTASLDAQTEHALFERYAGASKRVAQANGAITILVSHRFSTVRMADMIVVVDGGRIVETGSHSELMRSGGLYAELYELQARAYR